MSIRRRSFQLIASAFAAAALASSSSVVRAEGDEDAGKDLDELVARLRNPVFAKLADRDLQIVQLILRQKTPKADQYLRDLLADTGAHPTVVLEIAIATLLDGEHRLLPDVIDRVRRESGSELDRSLDVPLVTYSDASVVARLVEFARDAARPLDFRRQAVELLGRTGSPEALDPLLDLWGGPQKELREVAARAFDRVLPSGAATREEAAALREEIRGVPFAEALRRLLRRQAPRPVAGAPVAGGDAERDYVRLAAQMLPRATAAQLVESYLTSSSAAVRAMGAKRLGEFPFETAESADAKVRAARECLAALRREDVEAVELELLAAATTLAPELRGAVGEADLASLTERIRLGGRASNAVRLATVRLVGGLRDPRAVAAMEDAFTSLKDGDVEMRLALLDALQQAPGDLTQWLIARLSAETHSRVVRKLVLLLNRADDPAAIDAFRGLLAKHPDQQVRWDVAKALGALWAGRRLASARDALMELGLADADPIVRRTSADALGSPGPEKDAVVARLATLLITETDPKVRQAAAKSIVELDEAAAAKNLLPYLADDPEIWRLFRDRLVEDVRRRDKTPERVLAAADVLQSAGLARLAIDLLTQVGAAHDGLWEGDGGRSPLLERLASLLLDVGDPDAARESAQALLDGLPTDAATPRAGAELLLATARCRSGRQDELRAARRSLERLRSGTALAADRRRDADVELGDCMLRLGDALASKSVLAAAVADPDLPPRLAKKAAMLLDDAAKKVDADRKRLVALVDEIDGAGAADARAGLKDFGPRAAPYLLEALDESKDAAKTRQLLRCAAVIADGPIAEPSATASAEDVEKAVEAARAELRRVAERAASGGAGSR